MSLHFRKRFCIHSIYILYNYIIMVQKIMYMYRKRVVGNYIL